MSQCSAILRVLRDGKPHTVREIHAIAGFSRLNSRITDLRKQGYEIEHRVVDASSQVERHTYRLLSSPASTSPSRVVAAETATRPSVDPLADGRAQQQGDLFYGFEAVA